MPTVLKQSAYRFFFYAGDRGEPPHVHVERESSVAKTWLNPLRLAYSGDSDELKSDASNRLSRTISEQFLEAWNDFFTA